MEKTEAHEKHRTNRGQLVIPLDMPRTMKDITVTVLSGTTVNVNFSGGGGGSGNYVGYLTQMLVTELSNNAGTIQLKDKAGSGISPHFHIAGKTTYCWAPCPCPAGPICSGIDICNESIFGEVTLLVQIDPQVIE